MSVILSEEEVVQLCGGLKQPSRQLAELHRLGYWRARRAAITGRVVLERAHYESVCEAPKRTPNVKPPQLRPA